MDRIRIAVAFVALALGGIACEESDDQPNPGGDADTDADADGDTDADTDTDADGDADGDADADTDTGTGADAGIDTDTCGESDFKIEFQKTDMLIVLDRSNSMSDDNLWAPMGDALTQVTSGFSDRIDFGLMLFPNVSCNNNQTATVCAGPSAAYVAVGDADAPQAIADVFKTKANGGTGTCGGTPTRAALDAARAYLGTLADQHERYVLLATDGAPNCNSALSAPCTCTGTDCTGVNNRNCLDDVATYAAAKALDAAGHPVYVLGMGGGTKWGTQLQQIASSGGTSQYFAVDDTADLLDALEQITNDVASCDFQVDWDSLPSSASRDPGLVNFYCKKAAGDPIGEDNVVWFDDGCGQGKGWKWADAEHTRVELCEDACKTLKEGGCAVVTATFGCVSIAPP